jgi:DNA-binding transcriptional MerR regulator
MASAAAAREIPENALFRIGEVSRLTETKTFVLRFWESEFPTLQPVKSPAGHRLYRREDIETVLTIKRLLYDEGFTIAGARKHLAEMQGPNGTALSGSITPDVAISGSSAPESGMTLADVSPQETRTMPLLTKPRPAPASGVNRQVLLDVREELLAVLTLLKDE